jgi:hypothetical protein
VVSAVDELVAAAGCAGTTAVTVEVAVEPPPERAAYVPAPAPAPRTSAAVTGAIRRRTKLRFTRVS